MDKDKQRIMPYGPDDPAGQRNAGVIHSLTEFGHQETPPADLFAQRSRKAVEHPNNALHYKTQRNENIRREAFPTKFAGGLRDVSFVIIAAPACNPNN
jgi:hypothetical protein